MSTKMKSRMDSAVSPVIGVLLMLVVTIIIAAVVSGFAGGLAGDTKAAPSASIDVVITTSAPDGMGGTSGQITFEMLSGDSIPTKDLEIITYFTNSTGHIYKTSHTANSEMFDLYGYGTDNARLPYLSDISKVGYAGNNANADFGNYTWSTGGILSVGSTRQVADFLGLDWTAGVYPAPDTIDDVDFKSGASVELTILHTPSQKIVYSKEVVVK
ncbi:type IV pilin N-terminal domain-containing protein [Methanospirillum sp.]|uniref:type IV pilin N-terminal domain-containing protein n=1 Tax=Methanospirillum sp. TaxID=45200 RepID=UPI0035A1B56A